MTKILQWVILSLASLLSHCKTVSFISDSKAARDARGIVATKFTFHGNQATAKLRGNDSIGGLYFFPREKLLKDRDIGDCNQFLRKASFSLFPTKSETQFKERVFPLWSHEPHTFYALFVDAATCYPQYPTQSNVGLELHLMNDEASGGHLSAEENGLKAAYLLLLVVFCVAGAWFGVGFYGILAQGAHTILVMQLYLVCCLMQGLSLLLPAIHWLTYEGNGWGTPFLYSLTTLTSLLTDLAMTGLIVDISIGWTLGSNKRMTTEKSEKVMRMVLGLGLMFVALHFHTQTLDTNDPSYYSYSSWSELMLGATWVLKCCLYLAVLAGTCKDDRSALRQDFYFTFAWIVVGWCAAYPTSQIIVLFMAEYNRVKIMVGVSQFVRVCALAQLANLFVKRSVFWETSTANALPFAERSFATKENSGMFGAFNGYNEKVTKRS